MSKKKKNLKDIEENNVSEKELEVEATEAKENSAEEAEKEELSVEDEVEKLKAEVAEAKDKYLRLYSEFDNYRRRTAKEKLDLMGSANEELMQALLPVVDDFERAQKANSEKDDIEALKEGFDLIYKKYVNILQQKGLKVMDIEAGSEFDTELHDAVTQIPAPEDNMKGKIVDVIEKGYYLNDKVIRFAKVVTGA